MIEILDFFAQLWPSGNDRHRRWQRLGLVLGLALFAIAALLVVLFEFTAK